MRELRRKKHYSQALVGMLIGESQSVVSRMENGEHKLTVSDILRLAIVYETDVVQLFFDVRNHS